MYSVSKSINMLRWLAVVICCMAASTSYALSDIQIPARTTVWDYAQILGDSASEIAADLESFGGQQDAPHLYVVTIQDSYRPYMRDFINSICSGWRICQDDNNVLLVMTDAHNPYLYIRTAPGNVYVSDTMARYLAESYLPGYLNHKSPAAIASDFLYTIQQVVTGDTIMVVNDDYRKYKETYHADTEDHHDRGEMPVLRSGTTKLFWAFVVMAVGLAIAARVVSRRASQ